MKLGRHIAWAAALLAAPSGWAAEEVADHFVREWYVAEMIVFQRPEVMEFNTREHLLQTDPLPLPANMRTAFGEPDAIGIDYPLDMLTREALELEFRTIERPATFIVEDPEAENVLTLPAPPPEPPPTPLGDPPPTIAPRLEPTPLMKFLDAVAQLEQELEAQSYRWLAESEHVLQRTARILSQRFNSEILFQGRWLQPVPQRGAPQPIYLQLGPQPDGNYRLEGTVDLTIGRFLHFRAQLSLLDPGLAPVWVPVSLAPASIQPLPAPTPGFMVLNESRRMRSEEVHYLDHPKLGVVVRVDPVPIPEDLQLAFETLQEFDE